MVSYRPVGICHPSSHISSPTEVYLDSTIQISFTSFGSAPNAKKIKPTGDGIYIQYVLGLNSTDYVSFHRDTIGLEIQLLYNRPKSMDRQLKSNRNQVRAKGSRKERKKNRTTRE